MAEKIRFKTTTGDKIKIKRYDLIMLLDEFIYYLKEEGIKGLGREHTIAGLIVSKKVGNAIKKFVDEL